MSDAQYMKQARLVATRASCDRKHVGALIVDKHGLVAAGCNRALHGLDQCDDVGHMIVNNSCLRTVHAESVAIAKAARRGLRTFGATCYVTASPCWKCFQLLASAGILRIVFGEWFYRDGETISEAAKALGIELVDWSGQ